MTFKARMMVENPGEIDMTLKLTMSIAEWEKLRDQLGRDHPSWRLTAAITDMMSAAKKVYYASDEPVGNS